jgi:pyruvate dehydrogenase E1 component alpha subunit
MPKPIVANPAEPETPEMAGPATEEWGDEAVRAAIHGQWREIGVSQEELNQREARISGFLADWAPEAAPNALGSSRANGALAPAPPTLEAEQARAMYACMVRTRLFDARMVSLQRQGRIAFFVPSLGEEAAQVGVAYALRAEDWVFPAYREQGVLLARGCPFDLLVAQYMGNSADLLKGRQMPNHFGSPRYRFAAASSPVGTQIPHAVGAAWSARLRGEEWIAAVFFGDGATSTGDFHAGLNLAAVQQLPVVFFCKNNGWAISMPRARQTRVETLAEKAAAYGMPGISVDGNDLLAVYHAAGAAAARARAGGGPVLVELVTQRMAGHSTSDDPTRYRDPELLEPWKQKDPIARFRQHLEGQGCWTEADEQALAAATDAAITEAIQQAERLPAPPLESAFADVYHTQPAHLAEQQADTLTLAPDA